MAAGIVTPTQTRIPADRKRRWQPLAAALNGSDVISSDINFEQAVNFEQDRMHLFNFERYF
ncbi:hypothetical protein [Serratia ureilytica]|uniref:hypothetical protein n=1 Tax=Serratia ureilytica TaxID=300181 RepID=UPI0034C61776